MITGKNYIGSGLSATGTETYKTFNPKLNSENEWDFTEATEAEVDEAAQIATEAFAVYKQKSDKERAAFLRAIAEEIEALGQEVIDAYTAESGLPEGRAMGERGRTIGQLNSFAALLEQGDWVQATIDHGNPDRSPAPKPDLRKMQIAIGPVAVFGASNFPFAFSTAGGDTASALAAGCPVIVKSHPMHAGTGELISSAVIKAAEKTGMPNGIFSNLNSKGISVGEQLVKHPAIKAVGFTGSIKAGTALTKLGANRKEPIPVYAEMGSINPVVILPEALKAKGETWAQKYAGSINLGAGQFCTNPGLILGIEGAELDTFGKHLAAELGQQPANCMLHPNIHNSYESGKQKMLDANGTEVLAVALEAEGANDGKPALVKVSADDFLANPNLHSEVFGPFSMLVACTSKAQLLEVLNTLEGQLTGSLIAEATEVTGYTDVIDALRSRVGRILFNGVPTGVEVCSAMHHGGPFPSTSDSKFTSVGNDAIYRWVRPVSYQDWPQEFLPDALKDGNPLGILRKVDGAYIKA
ncbi:MULTISPECIES: aldehyde dehydrogenase (NADP(+)) [unclassified Leeuwenhoekiella]|uniref:aldehyde dehydrogenase (NADP(+)) n=1 Tax=unclassified Leeuwenhoekiella TaxID=2615029 RepID=UPI000C42D4AC|nr:MULTISPECIES: aldehyde dehydrogenase (NADP(+)) [unclassified Leeuwenhoekiella]MBA82486.1 aldehyde dehydrogenase (NADP(+)) [Leeuwenhoekiella sp.]|tara:strand:- start:17636 stop:19213 length:1578 start_codon:yes stop_codon:yes gene_type:complete